MRWKLFEFEDLSWFPETIRNSMTDYLRYIFNAMNFYQPVTPLIKEGLDHIHSNDIIDLCSGGGGPIEQVQQNIKQQYNKDVKITLSDKFPNQNSFEFLRLKTRGKISYSPYSIDATKVPSYLKGFRTIFSGFHHFNRQMGKAVIQNAVDAKRGIGIFDGGEKNIFIILGMILFHPIAFLLLTPFFKPFRISRLIFTYLIPIIPICTIWDGIVSITRLYEPYELMQLAKATGKDNYTWKAGKIKNKFGIRIAYLVGYPNSEIEAS